MEQDTRIGLALGILLMGIVAALFFRNESSAETEVPEIADAESLDARIAEREIGPYLSERPKVPPARPEVLAHNAQRPQRRTPRSEPLEVIPYTRRSQDSTARATERKRDVQVPAKRQPPRRTAQKPLLPPTLDLEAPDAVAPPAATTVKPELQEYEVVHGDTLSDIAERFLGSSARYMEIFELNRDRLRTPHDLRTGRRIRVPRSPE